MLLYELLTGTTPFDKERFKQAGVRRDPPDHPRGGAAQAEHAAESTVDGRSLPSSRRPRRHTEPAKLTKLVRGELDWIVMKALEKDRIRRYETANGLALDVQRYLAGEPVEAVPPPTGYRLRKFVRRNKGPRAGGEPGAAALVAGRRRARPGGWSRRDVARDDAASRQKRLAGTRPTRRAASEGPRGRAGERRRTRRPRASGGLRSGRQAERNLAFAKKGNEILGSVFAGLDPKTDRASRVGRFRTCCART